MAEMERMELERADKMSLKRSLNANENKKIAKILNQTQIKWMMLRITQLFNINFCSQTANMITFEKNLCKNKYMDKKLVKLIKEQENKIFHKK